MSDSMSRRGLLSRVSAGSVAALGLSTVGAAGAVESEDGDSPAPWSSYRGGSSNLGSMPVDAPELETRQWQIGHDDGVTAPVVGDDSLFLGIGSRVIAIDSKTGAETWSYDVESEVMISPAFDSETGTIVVTAEDGSIVGLSESGEERWSLGISGYPGAPTVEGGFAYVGSSHGTLVSIAVESGDPRWREDVWTGIDQEIPVLWRVTPAVSDGTVYANFSGYTGSSEIVAVDAADGSVEWRFGPNQRAISAPAVDEDMIYVNGDPDMIAVSKGSGSERWRKKMEARLPYPPTVTGDVVTAVSFSYDVLYAVDRISGEELWSFALDSGWYTGATSHTAERAYVLDARADVLRAIDLENGLQQDEFKFDDDCSATFGPVITDDVIYVPLRESVHAVGAERTVDFGETDSSAGASPTPDGSEGGSDGARGASSADESPSESDSNPSGSNSLLPEHEQLRTADAVIGILVSLATLAALVGKRFK